MKGIEYWEYVRRTAKPAGPQYPRSEFIRRVREVVCEHPIDKPMVKRLNEEVSSMPAHEAMLVEFIRVRAGAAEMADVVEATKALDWIRDRKPEG